MSLLMVQKISDNKIIRGSRPVNMGMLTMKENTWEEIVSHNFTNVNYIQIRRAITLFKNRMMYMGLKHRAFARRTWVRLPWKRLIEKIKVTSNYFSTLSIDKKSDNIIQRQDDVYGFNMSCIHKKNLARPLVEIIDCRR